MPTVVGIQARLNPVDSSYFRIFEIEVNEFDRNPNRSKCIRDGDVSNQAVDIQPSFNRISTRAQEENGPHIKRETTVTIPRLGKSAQFQVAKLRTAHP